MARRPGFLGKAYFGTAGGNPATEVTTIVDLTSDFAAGSIAANDRGNPDFEKALRGRKAARVDLTLNWDDADVDGFQAALEAAFDDTDPANQLIAFKALDKTSGSGWYGDFRVMNYSRSEPDAGVMTLNVQLQYETGFTRV